MRTPTPMYRELARLLAAQENCRKSNNSEWEDKHGESIARLMQWFPSGSGIDNGTKLDDSSTSERLVFTFGYHHMNEGGYYDGWTEHTLIVKSSLQWEIDTRITGRNRNDIKEYLHEIYHRTLTAQVWQSADCEWHCSLWEESAV